MKCPHCLKEIHIAQYSFNAAKRRELIIKNIDKEILQCKLYQIVRRYGYSYGKRTFHRDIKCLIDNNLIKKNLKIGGNGGSIAIIKKIDKFGEAINDNIQR